jgi:hypothetical protein
MLGQELPRRLPEPPPRSVAGDGVADLFAGGEPKASLAALGPPAGRDHDRAAPGLGPVADEQKLRPAGQPDDFKSLRGL